MKWNTLPRLLGLLGGLALIGDPAWAVDSVTRRSTEKVAAGEITSVTRDEVVVKPKVGSETTVPSNDIIKIEWDGAPPALNLSVGQELAGNFANALTGYKESQEAAASSSNSNMKADIQFLVARATARQALQQNEGLDEAATLLDQFIERFRDHYRFYEAQLLRGEVAIAQGDYAAADSAFSSLSRSPFADFQMAAKIGNAKTMLARNDVQAAKAAFDQVAGMNASTPLEVSRKLEAMLGQANCLQSQSQYEPAAKILDQVIRESSPDDTRLQAEAYVRQGECYSAIGENTMQAIMAYLHVDVVPSLAREKEYRAEALYHLSQLWPVVNQPARAAEAAATLEQEYPESEWTKKLGGR